MNECKRGFILSNTSCTEFGLPEDVLFSLQVCDSKLNFHIFFPIESSHFFVVVRIS